MVASNVSSVSATAPAMLCYYVNTKTTLQIARISNPTDGNSERIVLPGQGILFETLPESEIEIYTYSKTDGETLLKAIPCPQIQVQRGG
jgi:Domain of unknown function (DUF1830)